MKDWRSIRVKGAVALLCVSALFYAVEILRRTHILITAPQQSATLNETRLAQVKTRLPSSGVVGYVSDDSGIDESVAWRRFAMTQYKLAPLIVERNTEHELIVGVFNNPSAIPSVVDHNNLRIVEEFDEGVVLLQRK